MWFFLSLRLGPARLFLEGEGAGKNEDSQGAAAAMGRPS